MKKRFIFLILGILLVGTLGFFILQKDITQEDDLKPTSQIVETSQGKIIKEYSPSEKLLILKDIETESETLSAKLNTPQNYKVGAGYGKVAQFTINSKQDYNSVLGAFELYDKKKNNALIERQIDIKYLTIQQVEENVYGKGECSLGVNGTETCKQVVVGTRLVEKEVWLFFDNSVKTNEKIVIGLFTDVQVGDKVEWMPTIAGVRVSEWAGWTAALDVGLTDYLKLNEGGGITAINEIGNNWSITGSPANSSGLIGSAYNFSASGKYVNRTLTLNNDTWSISFWAYMGTLSTNSYFFFQQSGRGEAILTNASNYVGFMLEVGGWETIYGNKTISVGAWHHIVFMFNNTNNKGIGYVDGNLAMVNTYTDGWSAPTATMSFPRYNVWTQGILDEIGIWNRSLTSAEVTQLYNGGSGITYEVIDLEITLLSPEDKVNLTTNDIDFSSNVLDAGLVGIQNVTIEVFNSTSLVFNETNTSGFEGFYNFSNTFTDGDYDWNITAYDDSNVSYSSVTREFLVARLLLITETYDTMITEGLTTTFSANFLTNGSDITLAILYYNSTTNTGTINNHGGNNFTVIGTITAPSVDADINLSFYWNITQGDLGYTAIDPKNQTVLNLGIDNCTVNSEVLYNFTIVDERTQTKLIAAGNNTDAKVDIEVRGFGTPTLLEQFNKSYSQINPFAVCFNSTEGQFNIDVQIQYDAGGYEIEFYHIQNATINSTSFPTNITLFDLNSTQSQLFKLIVKDSSFLAIENALVEVHRKYIEEGVFKIVEIPRTDGKGETAAHLVIQDAIYKFVIKKYGVTIASFENVIAVCQTPLVTPCTIDFNAFAETVTVPDFEEAEDFLFTLGFNSTSRVISSVFNIPSGTTSVVAIEVIKEDALGTSVCTDTLTSSSGTLNCDVGASVGNSTVLAKIYKNGNLQAQGQVKLDQNPIDIYGGVLVILALFIMMTLIGAGISDNPVYTVLFLMVGVILLFALNLVASSGFIGATATILWLIVAVILIIIKGGRRS